MYILCHINIIVNKANMLVGLIKRNFNYKPTNIMSMEMFINLYIVH